MSTDLVHFAQNLINGLSLGAIYALIALGYTMVYGVLRLINFAHGEIYMMGAMTSVFIAARQYAVTPGELSTGRIVVVALLAIVGLLLLIRALSKRFGGDGSWLLPVMLLITAMFLAIAPFVSATRIEPAPTWVGFLLTLLGAMALCAALGFTIERLAYRPLRHRPRLDVLITAIGVSMFLQYGGQAVFGAAPQILPPLLPGTADTADTALAKFSFGPGADITITKVEALILLVSLVLMVALHYLVMHTRVGLGLRAVSHRFDVAALMGVNIDRAVSLTFLLGSALAGAAGVLMAVKNKQVDPLMGLLPGIKAFVAAVLGGIGSIPGALLGALLLGMTEALVSAYLSSEYRDAVAFVILILVLLLKPSGLLGRHGVEKV